MNVDRAFSHAALVAELKGKVLRMKTPKHTSDLTAAAMRVVEEYSAMANEPLTGGEKNRLVMAVMNEITSQLSIVPTSAGIQELIELIIAVSKQPELYQLAHVVEEAAAHCLANCKRKREK